MFGPPFCSQNSKSNSTILRAIFCTITKKCPKKLILFEQFSVLNFVAPDKKIQKNSSCHRVFLFPSVLHNFMNLYFTITRNWQFPRNFWAQNCWHYFGRDFLYYSSLSQKSNEHFVFWGAIVCNYLNLPRGSVQTIIHIIEAFLCGTKKKLHMFLKEPKKRTIK